MAPAEVPGSQSTNQIIRDIECLEPDAGVVHHALDACLADLGEPYILYMHNVTDDKLLDGAVLGVYYYQQGLETLVADAVVIRYVDGLQLGYVHIDQFLQHAIAHITIIYIYMV